MLNKCTYGSEGEIIAKMVEFIKEIQLGKYLLFPRKEYLDFLKEISK